MLKITTKVTGLQEFIKANQKFISAFESGELIKEIAEYAEDRAKYRAPRKTGTLIKHIKFKINGPYSFTLECDATNESGESYPYILEFGLNRFIPIGTPENPRAISSGGGKTAYLPFMRWAVWRAIQEVNKIMKNKINKIYK